jgi:adenine/guanine phosphoribosyltransferase-like PRPP-binding protein/uncharacterized HAD superfamily protein
MQVQMTGECDRMRYRSIADMTDLIRRNLHLVPGDVDLIVGVPRSGILPAITLSLLLNLRFADLDSLCEGRLPGSGSTKPGTRLIRELADARHVLIVDDSLNRGCAMREVREKLARAGITARVSLAAIYVVPDGIEEVDIAFEILPLPRIFEWNFFHHTYLSRACISVEGVLCPVPAAAARDSAPAYAAFLETAPALCRPTQTVACLLSVRPESCRPALEAWLARHGIGCERLVMLDCAGPATRPGRPTAAEIKGRFYREAKEMLLVEEDPAQSASIVQIAGKPVFCTASQEMVSPGAWAGTAALQRLRGMRRHAAMSDSPLLSRQALRRRLRRILPRWAYGAMNRMIALVKGSGGAEVVEQPAATDPVAPPQQQAASPHPAE